MHSNLRLYGKPLCQFHFSLPSQYGSSLKEWSLLPLERILFFKSLPHFRRALLNKETNGKHKNYLFTKWQKNILGLPIQLNRASNEAKFSISLLKHYAGALFYNGLNQSQLQKFDGGWWKLMRKPEIRLLNVCGFQHRSLKF